MPVSVTAQYWPLGLRASETRVALLTSTPGVSGANVLENAQIAAVRDVTDRYAGTGRVLTHTIVHPNVGPGELDRMVEWARALREIAALPGYEDATPDLVQAILEARKKA